MTRSRLANVVRVRRLQEQLARGGVARSRQAARQAEQHRATTVRLVDELAAGVPREAGAFVGHRRRVDGGVRAIRLAGEAAGEARVAVAGSLDDWVLANRRLDGVQRLDERRTAAALVELDRRELAEVDDLTLARWNRARTAAAAPDRPEGTT